MSREKIMVELFQFSAPTYYKWSKQQKRKIFDLLNYAFSEEELKEFLETNRIKRIEKEKSLKFLDDEVVEFLKRLIFISNYRTTINCLNLLEETYKKDNYEINIHNFINELYLQDKTFFKQLIMIFKDPKVLKYELSEAFKKQNKSFLNYICSNLNKIIDSTSYLKDRNYERYEDDKVDDIIIDEFSLF